MLRPEPSSRIHVAALLRLRSHSLHASNWMVSVGHVAHRIHIRLTALQRSVGGHPLGYSAFYFRLQVLGGPAVRHRRCCSPPSDREPDSTGLGRRHKGCRLKLVYQKGCRITEARPCGSQRGGRLRKLAPPHHAKAMGQNRDGGFAMPSAAQPRPRLTTCS
jgi:hypothetical protein